MSMFGTATPAHASASTSTNSPSAVRRIRYQMASSQPPLMGRALPARWAVVARQHAGLAVRLRRSPGVRLVAEDSGRVANVLETMIRLDDPA